MENNNKTLKVIISVLLVFCAAIVTVPGAVYYVRGELNNVELPPGFESSLGNDVAENEGDIRIMSSNLLVHYESWGGTPAKPRAKMYIEMLNTCKPDVIGVQEMSDEWFCCLNRNLPRGYKMLNSAVTGSFVRMTAMVYNSNTLDLIESDEFEFDKGDNPRLRRVVWAVFEDKETGKRFAVTNTHFDLIREGREEELKAVMESQRDEIISISNEIADNYDCPVFSVGDFNTMEDTSDTKEADIPEIYNFLAESLVDTKYASSNQAFGSGQTWEYPSYDHIFMNGSADIDSFCLMSYDYLSDMSDHYPIFADIIL